MYDTVDCSAVAADSCCCLWLLWSACRTAMQLAGWLCSRFDSLPFRCLLVW
jgi:hypothetical protein